MKLKSIIVYGLLILLCVCAVVGYLVVDSGKSATVETAAAASAGTAGEASAAEPASTAQPPSSGSGTEAESTGAAPAEPTAAISADKQAHIDEIMQRSAAEPDPNPVIGIGRGADYAKVTEEAVNNAGGLAGVVGEGDTVVIKPNLCTLAESESGKTTDYRTVQKIADMVKELGAARVIVAEGTIAGNAFHPIYLKANKYDQITGVELVDLNSFHKEDCYELQPSKSLTGRTLFIPKVYMDADVVINVAKLKTHFVPEAFVSLSLKNSYGVPPGQIYGLGSKDGLHVLGFNESVIDLNRIRKPEFSVIEGIVGGEGYGPLSNDPVQSEIILAGRDPVALDTVALTFMGFTLDQSPHIKLAGEEKLGISDLNSIKVVGADLNAIKMDFRAYNEFN